MILAMQEWLWLAVTVALAIVGGIAFLAIRKAQRIERQERRRSSNADHEWRRNNKSRSP